MSTTYVIAASDFERLFYRLQAAQDDMQLTQATLEIAKFREGTREYAELVQMAGERRCQLEHERLSQRN